MPANIDDAQSLLTAEIAFLSDSERLRAIARCPVGVVHIALLATVPAGVVHAATLLVTVPIGAKEVKVVGSMRFRLTRLSSLPEVVPQCPHSIPPL